MNTALRITLALLLDSSLRAEETPATPPAPSITPAPVEPAPRRRNRIIQMPEPADASQVTADQMRAASAPAKALAESARAFLNEPLTTDGSPVGEAGHALEEHYLEALRDYREADAARRAEAKPGMDATLAADEAVVGDLHREAWKLLTGPAPGPYRVDRVLRVMGRAEDLTTALSPQRPEILRAYARALFMAGKQKEGIAVQKRAIEAAVTHAEKKAKLQAALAAYEKGELPKE